MKHPKRFCTECDQDVYLTIRGGEVPMYHCRKCGAEVCRVGDGDATRRSTNIQGGLTETQLPDDINEGVGLTDLARMNPDILSDEHAVWPARDRKAEIERQAEVATFSIALERLTARQREVVDAVDKYGSSAEAARRLNVSPKSVSGILRQARKKLSKYVRHPSKRGIM